MTKKILVTYILWDTGQTQKKDTYSVRFRYGDGTLSPVQVLHVSALRKPMVLCVDAFYFSVIRLSHPYSDALLPAMESLLEGKTLTPPNALALVGFKNADGMLGVACAEKKKVHEWRDYAEKNALPIVGILPEDALYGQQSPDFKGVAENTFACLARPENPSFMQKVLHTLTHIRPSSPIFILGVLVLLAGSIGAYYSKNTLTRAHIHAQTQRIYQNATRTPLPAQAEDALRTLENALKIQQAPQSIRPIEILDSFAEVLGQDALILGYATTEDTVTLRVKILNAEALEDILYTLEKIELPLLSQKNDPSMGYRFVFKRP